MQNAAENTIERKPLLTKGQVATLAGVGASIAFAGVAGATPSDAETVATTAGTSFKDTGIDVITVLVPLAVGLIVAKRAFAMARSWVG